MTDLPDPPDVLVVEDDAALRELLQGRLADAGWRVRTAATGVDALRVVEEQVPDVVVLDVMLPGLDGLEVCRRLRAQHPLVYILMLTARSEELDRVVGLEVGADDYLTKPFSLQELVARIRAALRRIRATQDRLAAAPEHDGEERYTYGPLTVDVERREVFRDGQPVHLTVREFELLVHLARNADRPFTRMRLLEEIWGETYEGYSRTIDSHIQRLRSKIEDEPGNPLLIRTVWGVGYKLASDPDEPQA
jgi:DNA-binding response OmpR family regulator